MPPFPQMQSLSACLSLPNVARFPQDTGCKHPPNLGLPFGSRMGDLYLEWKALSTSSIVLPRQGKPECGSLIYSPASRQKPRQLDSSPAMRWQSCRSVCLEHQADMTPGCSPSESEVSPSSSPALAPGETRAGNATLCSERELATPNALVPTQL